MATCIADNFQTKADDSQTFLDPTRVAHKSGRIEQRYYTTLLPFTTAYDEALSDNSNRPGSSGTNCLIVLNTIFAILPRSYFTPRSRPRTATFASE